jgi:hypothetical protein
MYEAIINTLEQIPTNPDHYRKPDFAFETGAPGVRTKIATLKATRLVALRSGVSMDLVVPAVQTFTTDGNAGNTQTFGLNYNLIDSNATPVDLVLYENGAKVSPDAIDRDNDEFTYTDDGTDNDLTAFYATDEQARVVLQVTAANGTPDAVFSGNMGSIHRREVAKRPLTLELDQSPLQGVIPKDFTLDLYVEAPYTAAYEYDNGHGTVRATNALLQLPIRGASGAGPQGVKAAVRQDMSTR